MGEMAGLNLVENAREMVPFWEHRLTRCPISRPWSIWENGFRVMIGLIGLGVGLAFAFAKRQRWDEKVE